MDIDVILEQFKLDPLSEYSKIFDNNDFIVEDGNEFLRDAYMEATTGATKGNVLQRLWTFIMKILRWLCKQWSRFVNFVKKLFSRKVPIKGSSQILSEIGVEPSSIPSEVSSDVSSAKKGAPREWQTSPSKDDKIKDMQDRNTSERLNIPVNPASTTKPIDANMVSNDFFVKFEGNNINISFYDVKALDNGIKNMSIKGQPVAYVSKQRGLGMAMNCIKNPEIFNGFKIAVGSIRDQLRRVSNGTKDQAGAPEFMAKTLDQTLTRVERFSVSNYVLSLDDIMQFQKTLSATMEIFEEVNKTIENWSPDQYDQRFVNVINNFANDLSIIQMGVNQLTGAISQPFIIDNKYQESINDINTLSKFVSECIKYGIPSKYIGFNVYQVSTSEIKGDGSKGSAEHPIWGQSRLVLFPNNQHAVYKIALNRMGMNANSNEERMYKIAENSGAEMFFAKVLGSTTDKCLVTMQKAENIGYLTDSQVNYVKRKLNELSQRLNWKYNPSQDIHAQNVGTVNGELVCVDYGDIALI